MKISTHDGELIEATYVRHLRTLVTGSGCYSSNTDVDLYRTEDGRLVAASSPANDGRVTPVIDPTWNVAEQS